ncbi:MAG: 4-hydroxy-3-methylbut-2-enyl diphosphate reductase [Planctomycetota bacterium]
MQVIRAEHLGFCFGVRDALEVTFSQDRPEDVTIHGELVHNESVLARLRARGFRQEEESERDVLPSTERVLVTAHGISQSRRQRLLAAGHELIDTTCPLVAHLHAQATSFSEQGFHIILIGKPGHVEVRGVLEDLDQFTLVEKPSDVKRLPHARLGILAQTTTPAPLAEAIVARVESLNPDAEIRWVNTICEPTRKRILSVRQLAEKVDVIVVVGGRNSNNTLQLVNAAREARAKVRHVQGASDLQPHWFLERGRVGLAAGTSTPEEAIDAVESGLLRIGSLLGIGSR